MTYVITQSCVDVLNKACIDECRVDVPNYGHVTAVGTTIPRPDPPCG
ncbi:hypothetical protein SAMN04515665_12651 [Blastococcus sp. DSM 46786]|nr:hypothetical protein [Blastococcus sp. DSM 46786]SEM02011.1 hypothetical protein SAMN04515665_12651 [Blastococcus sp. DSM 46786]